MRDEIGGRYELAHLLRGGEWLCPAFLEVASSGVITRLERERPIDWADHAVESLQGFVVAGAINVHSHAHLRALAGRLEATRVAGRATLWSWRDGMYDLSSRIGPEELEAIATQAFMEMLRAGFTAVAEFHYLHHDPTGMPYADPCEMSKRLISAARRAGIRLTLLPALYRHGGIGRAALPEQRRFVHASIDDFLRLIEEVRAYGAEMPDIRIGVAPHSLRAVAVDELRELADASRRLETTMPIHMHASEQEREVEECIVGLGSRPIQWLLDHVNIDQRWTIVHATHADADERARLAAAGAVVALCPTTEANLGDGLFSLIDYSAQAGRWGIGSDMHVGVDPAEELRMLEYGQRLLHRRRDILTRTAMETAVSPGQLLYDRALAGGAQALGQPVGVLEPGRPADLVVLDARSARLAGHSTSTVLDAWLFASGDPPVRDVMVNGRWVVRNARHEQQAAALETFRETVARLG